MTAKTAAFLIIPDGVYIRVLPKLIDKIPYNTCNRIFCGEIICDTHSIGLG